MKTILYLSTSSGPGGAEKVISSLVGSLDRRRFRPVLCLFRSGWLKDNAELHGVQTLVLPTHGRLGLAWMWQFAWLLRDEKVDLIHAHEFDANVQGTLAAFLCGVPIVVTIHGKNYYWEKLRRRIAYRWVSRHATMVAVSNNLKEFIGEKVGVAPARIRVVYNGVDTLPSPVPDDVRQCRKNLSIPESDSVVGVIGNLYPVKGHQYLVEAIPTVLRACPHTSFVFAGRGQLEVTLKQQVRVLGIDQHVHFLGLRDDIPRLLAMLDVFVLPSLSEGLSMAILEAMVAGKPILATRVGGNPELLVDQETGLLVPPRDSQALASRLISLLVNRQLAASMAEKARQRAQTLFGLETMVQTYQELYETCLHKKG